jgi:hypothetical protein
MGGNATTTPHGWPDSRGMVKLRSVGTFLLGIAALIFSGLSYQAQKRNTERDLELKAEQNRNGGKDLDLKRAVTEHIEPAKLAISVIPMLNCKDGIEDDLRREAVFGALVDFPNQKTMLSALIVSKCPKLSSQARKEISDIRQSAFAQQVQADFRRTLANARQYQQYGVDGVAARLFFEARNLLPEAFASEVDKAELEKAKDAYEQGNFSEASGRFQKAFSRIP